MTDVPSPIPEGFEQLPRGLGFNDVMQPIYRRASDESGIAIGIVVEEQHCNMMGIVHGGVLMTLSDMAAAQGINHKRGKLAGAPTMNLSVDFINPGERGDWLEASCDRVEIKKRFGYASGVVTGGRGIVARFSGIFYLPEHKGMLREGNKLHLWEGRGDQPVDG